MKAERGFTLLEVMIAFLIAALALGVLFQGASGGLEAVHAAGAYEEAVARAQSHLAAIGRVVTLAPGELQGDDGDGYHWRLRVARVAESRLPGSDATPSRPAPPQPIALYRVTVAISWDEAGRRRELSLETARLGVAPRAIDE